MNIKTETKLINEAIEALTTESLRKVRDNQGRSEITVASRVSNIFILNLYILKLKLKIKPNISIQKIQLGKNFIAIKYEARIAPIIM